MDKENLICPICKTKSSLLDVVDLNKPCIKPKGYNVALAGIPIYYALCNNCDFCWAVEMHTWPLSKFEEWIYNGDYHLFDPEYIEIRPKANANSLRSMFPALPSTIRHLDYGGGNGVLSQSLRESGWSSVSYDPFVDKNTCLEALGTFDLITAYEVFEHVPDVQMLMSELSSVLADDGMVLFSTLLSDGEIHADQRLSWWYASPRNGHISLFSQKSLAILAFKGGFKHGSFSRGLHVLFKQVPPWASHLFRKG